MTAAVAGSTALTACQSPDKPGAVAKDGSLLVTEDEGGTMWRVAYTGARR